MVEVTRICGVPWSVLREVHSFGESCCFSFVVNSTRILHLILLVVRVVSSLFVLCSALVVNEIGYYHYYYYLPGTPARDPASAGSEK